MAARLWPAAKGEIMPCHEASKRNFYIPEGLAGAILGHSRPAAQLRTVATRPKPGRPRSALDEVRYLAGRLA